MANPYSGYINQTANAWGVNPTVLNNIARLESSYNPSAVNNWDCLLYTSPSPRDYAASRMPSSA